MPTWARSKIKSQPRMQPTTAPTAPIIMPSITNNPISCRPFMPNACKTPISRVRSKTAISIRLRMPMLAMSNTINPNMLTKTLLMASNSCSSGLKVSQESKIKSFQKGYQ